MVNPGTKEVPVAQKKDSSNNSTDSELQKIIKISLRTKIIWLIVLVVAIIMLFTYNTILRDERAALIASMESSGGALATLLANNSRVALNNALLDESRSGNITQDTYERLDYFGLGFADTLDQMIDQKDMMYAVIINRFGMVVSHSKSEPVVNENSPYKPLNDNLKLYRDIYVEGDPIRPIFQQYQGGYFDPKLKKNVEGELLIVAFPMVVDAKVNSLKAYEGEVQIGISKDSINKTIRNAEAKLQGVALVSLLIGIFSAIILASIIISPIKKLVTAMGKITNGDLKQKVLVKTGDEVQLLATSFNRMTDGLSKYVSAGLVKRLMKQEGLSLGGSYKKVTIMESDLRNFTGTSEKMKPDEVVSYLNEYLDVMTKIVLKYGGEVDKYIGDAILAQFGLFDPNLDNLPEHTKNCIRACVEMNQAMIQFNERQLERGRGLVRFGVGVNTGDIIVGNMGSTERMDYTIIGDNMNLTARICDHAGKDHKEENGNVVHLRNILITEPTYELVKDIAVVEDKIIHLKVKGKEKPIKVYQVYDVRG